MHGACSDSDDTNTEASVQERIVEVGALEGWHAAILTSLAVEDQVDAEEGCAEDTSAVEEALSHIALRERVGRDSLLVRAAEGRLELGDIGGGGKRGCLGLEEVRVLLQWRVVEAARREL